MVQNIPSLQSISNGEKLLSWCTYITMSYTMMDKKYYLELLVAMLALVISTYITIWMMKTVFGALRQIVLFGILWVAMKVLYDNWLISYINDIDFYSLLQPAPPPPDPSFFDKFLWWW